MDFSTELMHAIRNGSNEEVKSMIEASSLHLLYDKDGFSLLHYSAMDNNVEITQYLLDKGCDVNDRTRDEIGWTPLMLALEDRHCAIMQTLLKAGADIDIYNNQQQSVLEIVFSRFPFLNVLEVIFRELQKKYSTSEKIAQRLIDAKCSLSYAVYFHDASIVECMLEKGAALESRDYDNGTELHTAVAFGDVKTVQVLLKYGADVEALDMHDANPLYYLYTGNNSGTDDDKLAVLQALLERKISLTSTNEDGYFQVNSALCQGSREVVRLVLQSIEDFTVDDYFGQTVLHYIAENRNVGIIEELKFYMDKLEVNRANYPSITPLNMAVRYGNVDMVKFLLDHGAEIHDDIFDVYKLMDAKCKSQHDECAEILFQHNADPQAIIVKNDREVTIFDIAAEYQNFERINLALAHLAIIEKEGVPITELTYSKIYSRSSFEEYFRNCQRVLDLNVSGTVTVFKLLTVTKRQLANYLKNEDLDLILMRLEYKLKLQCSYPYYYNVAKKRLSAACVYKALRDKAVLAIGKLVGNELANNILITEEIIDYLEEQDLWKLYNLYNDVL